MKKYIIDESVDTSVVGIGAAFAGFLRKTNLAVVPVFGLPGLAAALVLSNSAIHIKTLDELKRFKNGLPHAWKKKVVYAEHPFRKNVLIEASLYKDFILREMVSDIADYIADNLDLQSLVIGLVSSKSANAGGTVPVQQLNVNARIRCNLDSNYVISLWDTHANSEHSTQYLWINQFPDVISSVRHGAGKMEICKKVKLDIDANINLANQLKLTTGVGKEYEFYIMYKKA